MAGAPGWYPNCCVTLEKCQVLSFSAYKWRTGLFWISESCHILRLFGLVNSFWSSVEIPEIPEYQQELLLSLVPWFRGCKTTSEVLQHQATDLENGPSKCQSCLFFFKADFGCWASMWLKFCRGETSSGRRARPWASCKKGWSGSKCIHSYYTENFDHK